MNLMARPACELEMFGMDDAEVNITARPACELELETPCLVLKKLCIWMHAV